MEKDCIHLTSEEKERLIEFKKSDKFLKAYKLIKEEIGLEERKKLFISVYQDHYLFQVPYTQEMLDAWSVETAALSLKELNQEIRDTVGIFYQLSM